MKCLIHTSWWLLPPVPVHRARAQSVHTAWPSGCKKSEILTFWLVNCHPLPSAQRHWPAGLQDPTPVLQAASFPVGQLCLVLCQPEAPPVPVRSCHLSSKKVGWALPPGCLSLTFLPSRICCPPLWPLGPSPAGSEEWLFYSRLYQTLSFLSG